MKRLLPILFLLVAALSALQASGQNSILTSNKTKHDFGTIAEDGGEVSCSFVATNSSAKPVVILSVSGGCSCTKAIFSQKPILTGGDSCIDITFDPMNQPEGRFMRKVIVTTSKGSIPLTLTGQIVPRKKSIDEQYTLRLTTTLRAECNAHAFGYIEQGQHLRSSIGVVNTSTRPQSIAIAAVKSSGLLSLHYPTTLASGEKGAIDFGYDLSAKSYYGQLHDVLEVTVDGVKADYQIVISALAIDSRNIGTDKEWQTIQLSENFIKFGTLKHTMPKAERSLEIRNIGMEPLVIRKIESQHSLFTLTLDGPTTITSDGSATLKVSIVPQQAAYGVVSDRIRIFTSDPQHPMVTVRVNAIIEE